jgi:hypothetical protein
MLHAPKIEFLDSSGRFLGNCFGKPVQILVGGKEAFFDTKCSLADPEKQRKVSGVRILPTSGT